MLHSHCNVLPCHFSLRAIACGHLQLGAALRRIIEGHSTTLELDSALAAQEAAAVLSRPPATWDGAAMGSLSEEEADGRGSANIWTPSECGDLDRDHSSIAGLTDAAHSMPSLPPPVAFGPQVNHAMVATMMQRFTEIRSRDHPSVGGPVQTSSVEEASPYMDATDPEQRSAFSPPMESLPSLPRSNNSLLSLDLDMPSDDDHLPGGGLNPAHALGSPLLSSPNMEFGDQMGLDLAEGFNDSPHPAHPSPHPPPTAGQLPPESGELGPPAAGEAPPSAINTAAARDRSLSEITTSGGEQSQRELRLLCRAIDGLTFHGTLPTPPPRTESSSR